MIRKAKKAFTIVELVIVIAVIAILMAVLIPTFVSLVKKANVSSDMQLVRNLNTALRIDGVEHETMTDALEAAEASGFDVEKINAKVAENEILWDSVNDCFVYMEEGKSEPTYIPESQKKNVVVKDYQFWQIAAELPATQKYSIYLSGTDYAEAVSVSVGFDAGRNRGIPSVTYTKSSEAQDVVIRTNGGALTVNADTDDVKHYGIVYVLTITAVRGTHCYHENGYVGNFISFGTGKFVAESSAVFHQTQEAIEAVLNGKDYSLGNGETYGQHYYVDGQCVVCSEDECQHVWSDWTTNDSTHSHTCTICEKTESGDHDTAGEGGKCSACGYLGNPCAEGHTVESWTVVQESTCTEPGYKVGTCTVCNELRVEEIPAAHTNNYYKTGNPYTDKHIAVCSVCGTMTTSANGEACDTDGADGNCSKCHSITHDCGTDGHIWYDNTTDYVCAICGSWHGTTHDTDGEGGCCSVCGYKAHEHTAEDWTVETAATCTTAGQKKGTCTQCGTTIKESIPATGHTISDYTGFDVFNHKGTCTVCGAEATQSHQYTFVSSEGNVSRYQCNCGVLMDVEGTENPNHEHTSL
ncbi:MAG: type II secretion system protein, partial [Christensenellaceae bacterium]